MGPGGAAVARFRSALCRRRTLPRHQIRSRLYCAVRVCAEPGFRTAGGLCMSAVINDKTTAARQRLLIAGPQGFMDATLWQHLAASLTRMLVALVAAAVIGIPVGISIGLSPAVRGLLDPLIELYRPVPPLAYLLLMVIWFGIGETSKILLIYLAIFAPVTLSTLAGVRNTQQVRLCAAQSLGASRWQLLRWVILPGALPEILTGLRIGLGVDWSTLVAAELIAATRGLGFMVQSAGEFLATDVVLAGIAVIALIAFILELGLRALQRRLTP
nr:taurine ABC transporter permease TauC [Candidatus Pantoea persica]